MPDKPQIWFLTGSQHLYGPETLDQVAAQSQQIQRMLSDSGRIGTEIVWRPVLTDSSAIRAIMQAANNDPRPRWEPAQPASVSPCQIVTWFAVRTGLPSARSSWSRIAIVFHAVSGTITAWASGRPLCAGLIRMVVEAS